jgi:TatD DNase family protein
MIIDTHAHYDNKRYDDDRDKLIAGLPARGVSRVVNCGCDLETSKAAIKLAARYSHVYATVGVHPHYASSLDDGVLAEIKALAAAPKVVAYGELGLDFHHNFSPPDVQREWFARQLELAHEVGLPVVIHSRDAADEVFATIKEHPVRRGVIHSYSGTVEMALEYCEMGFYIGIGGVVTFEKHADELKRVAAAIPLEKLLLETDCPYLTPAPHRGKRNESPYLQYVAEEIARLRAISTEEVCSAATANANALFLLS